MIIGSRIKEARLLNNMTQFEFGKLIDVSKVSVCNYELGTRTPNVKTLEKISDISKLSIDFLLGRDQLYIMEDELSATHLLDQDIIFINHLKKDKEVYFKIIDNPDRLSKLIKRNLK